jgi:hypothetical protein
MENYSISVHQITSMKTRIGTLKTVDLPYILQLCQRYAKRKNFVLKHSNNGTFCYIQFLSRYEITRENPVKSSIVDICIKIK